MRGILWQERKDANDMGSEDRDEASKKLFQDFYKSPLSDEAVERLREGLRKIYPEVDWEDKHINALKELHGANPMEWQIKHSPKSLGKFLSKIEVDVEQD